MRPASLSALESGGQRGGVEAWVPAGQDGYAA
ncbi:MAG: hypothetical protein QOI83_1978 [Streptomycetaceae bacterium]|jgi:hypothetical protein|nr:hypothetical protein [Streptomycetaceae bacterium]